MGKRKNTPAPRCRGGCKNFSFVSYAGKFNHHWPSTVTEYWPKYGDFKCRTCGGHVRMEIKPPIGVFRANRECYKEVNAAMRSNGLPEYIFPGDEVPKKQPFPTGGYKSDHLATMLSTAGALSALPEEVLSEMKEANELSIGKLMKKMVDRRKAAKGFMFADPDLEDKKKSAPDRVSGTRIRRYVVDGKIYMHEIFPCDDDRVEVLTFSEDGEGYVHLLTFTADNYVKLPDGTTIGRISGYPNWDFESTDGRKFSCQITGVEGHLDSEVQFVKDWFLKEWIGA